ncbi:hypothetical protein CesoFtcFv8_013230 [Champsocephalus esox]|uniref:HMG box domain-containing protein n=1 Tax=Champsocephalus esox TaxID=159716 RepID=A0AAN8GVV1_9TELE|nr:hypothetical protein CesoFtcFv8_013230 [Champsocephalus esox]
MSTDLPVSECRKSGPTRSLDFEIEKKKKRPKKRMLKKRRPKEVGTPKRPMSAYMLWLNIRQPKEEWDIKSVEAKKQYEIARQEFKDSGGGGASSSPKKESEKAGVKKKDVGLSWIPLGPRLKGGGCDAPVGSSVDRFRTVIENLEKSWKF